MRFANIDEFEVVNGEGAGVSLFVQGCNFRCPGCFNSEAWDFDGGQEWTEETESEFMNLIKKEYIKRVSILGGEPLDAKNYLSVRFLLKKIRQNYPNKKIWLYTGYRFEEIERTKELIRTVVYCDFLVDGRFEMDKKDLTLPYRGSSNQRIIDVQKTLEKGVIISAD